MTNLLQRETVVGPDGTIAVQVPELAPGQRVRVTIELEERPSTGRAMDVLTTLGGHRLFKTTSEVEAYIRAERDAWER